MQHEGEAPEGAPPVGRRELLEQAPALAVRVDRMVNVTISMDDEQGAPTAWPPPFLRKLFENVALAQAAVWGLGGSGLLG